VGKQLASAGWYAPRIAQQFAAVYAANAIYLGHEGIGQDEAIEIHIVRKATHPGRASHESTGPFRHEIEIPLKYFDDLHHMFHAFDAESRHAVHADILSSRGIDPSGKNDAKRASLVIAETIDEGESLVALTRDYGQQRDPYVNDFFLDPAEDLGHSGAQFLRLRLSSHPGKLRVQLRWLARLTPRTVPQGAIGGDLEAQLRALVLPPFSDKLEFSAPGEPTEHYVQHPYDRSTHSLQDFYLGKDPATRFLDAAARVRRNLMQSYPFSVPEERAVILQDSARARHITSFASQLDYVALRIATARTAELKREL
jgi:hypothetical protein